MISKREKLQYVCTFVTDILSLALSIALGWLVADGLLTLDPGEEFVPTQDERVEFDQVRENKEKLLRKAFHQSEKGLLPEIRQFLRDERWVSDFALFTAVKQHFGGVMWRQWPDEGIKMRRKESLLQYRMMLDEDVRYHVFCQFIFFRQWKEFKAYCNSKGIELFGDMPIYVAEDSADTWTQPEVFQLDKNRAPKRVAGVPPDYFSADGQMWGNPLYRWTYLFFRRYDWWVERMRGMSKLYDIVRVDHFIGFANYYSIPYGAPNARSGKWIVGPGKKLFRRLKKELPNLRVVAEDLGVQSDRVRELLQLAQDPISLETPVGEEEDAHLEDFIQDEEAGVPVDEAGRELLRRELANVLKSLTPREERVLTLRFGLEDGQARTLEELGKEFNVTRERIRQIEAKALRKLRHPSRAKRLRDYLEE